MANCAFPAPWPSSEDDEYEESMAKKADLPKTKFGDAFDPAHVEQLNAISKENMS